MSVPYAIIGTGGYGAAHLAAALKLQDEGRLQLMAVADPFPGRCPKQTAALKERSINHYTDWREMIGNEPLIKAVSIPAPIPLHVPMAAACFEKKLSVVLEKPPAVLIQDVDLLIDLAAKNGVICQVGFQNMMEPVSHKLKQLLLTGEIGELQKVTVFGACRRPDSYYRRTDWAGKLRHGGAWALDGPLNNPLSHFLQQGLFFAGREPLSQAAPVSVRAELFRAHPIEGEDIACSRAILDTGAGFCSYLTTCAPEGAPPAGVKIKGAEGDAAWTPGMFEINGKNGKHTETGARTGAYDVIKNFLHALHRRARLLSPLEGARSVILHNNACFISSGKIHPVPANAVKRYSIGNDDTATEVPGLLDNMEKAAAEGQLFSETGIEWAVQTREACCDFSRFDPAFLL